MEGAQVVILCGGRGTRMGSLTETVPKPMVKIANERPLLWHLMHIYAHYGFRRFILCLGYKGTVIKDYITTYLTQNYNFTAKIKPCRTEVRLHGEVEEVDWEITCVDTGLDSQTGARLKKVQPFIEGERFMVTYGDGLADVDIIQLLKFHIASGKMGTVTAVVPPSRFGELVVHGGIVTAFHEKPEKARYSFINGGFFVFERKLFDLLEDDPNLSLERHVLPELASSGNLAAWVHSGYWQCMDTPRDLEVLSEAWRSGSAPWKVW